MTGRKKYEKESYSRFSRFTYFYVPAMCLVLTILAVSSRKSIWASVIVLCLGGITTFSIFYLYRRSDQTNLNGKQTLPVLDVENGKREVITELDMKESTKELTNVKDQFISVVSHELRTPLNAISGWTRILRNSQITKETRDHALDVIEKNIRTQSRLVNELLDYSKIVSETDEQTEDEVNFSTIFEKVVKTARDAAEKKDIVFEKVNLLETGTAIGDSIKLEKMFLNVLLNAVKFTPRGGRIVATIQKVDDLIRFRVIDSGDGIEDKNLRGIFEGFNQADSSPARKYGGFGLGLAFSKQVAELHGGEIRAVSAGKGKGSAFTVDLPIKKSRQM